MNKLSYRREVTYHDVSFINKSATAVWVDDGKEVNHPFQEVHYVLERIIYANGDRVYFNPSGSVKSVLTHDGKSYPGFKE